VPPYPPPHHEIHLVANEDIALFAEYIDATMSSLRPNV
jgi:hypothetical protein